MKPDMSVSEMLDSFIYIVKGSRVIDRRAIDWGAAYWREERLVKQHVFTVAELKRYFAHRYHVKIKYNPRSRNERIVTDPVMEWFKHPDRFTTTTLADAMQLADKAARGLVEPRIDLDALEAQARVQSYRLPWERDKPAAA